MADLPRPPSAHRFSLLHLKLLLVGVIIGVWLAENAQQLFQSWISGILLFLLLAGTTAALATILLRSLRRRERAIDFDRVAQMLVRNEPVDSVQLGSALKTLASWGLTAWFGATSLSLLVVIASAVYSIGQIAAFHEQNDVMKRQLRPVVALVRVGYVDDTGLRLENRGEGPAQIGRWWACHRDAQGEYDCGYLNRNPFRVCESAYRTAELDGYGWSTFRSSVAYLGAGDEIVICSLGRIPDAGRTYRQLASFARELSRYCFVFQYRSALFDGDGWTTKGSASCKRAVERKFSGFRAASEELRNSWIESQRQHPLFGEKPSLVPPT